jgi:type IX secretion system PorP/SprF family membrane protein
MGKRNMKKIYTLIFLLCAWANSVTTRAQDMHFSQYNNCTQLINPALTGQFETMLKGTILHRRQWRNIGAGYTTSGLDAQYKLLSLNSDNFFGFGLLFLQDAAGLAQQKTLAVKTTAAYNMVITKDDLISAGFQMGFEQRSLNLDGLAWDSQYNGSYYDPSLDSKERIITTTRSFIDVGAGFHWKHRAKKRFDLGYALYHANQQISLVARGDDRMKVRQVFKAAWIKRYKFIDMKYDALMQRQSGSNEVMIGATADYRIGDESKYTNVKTASVARFGIYYRWKDAISPYIGFEYKRFAAISIGYDLRLAKMPYTSARAGGPEFSLTYLGMPERKRMSVIK